MSYYCDGKFYVKENIYKLVPDTLKKDLEERWYEEKGSFEIDGYVIYAFNRLEWDNLSDIVIQWNMFLDDLEYDEEIYEEDWDFLVVEEFDKIVDQRTQSRLGTLLIMEILE